MNKVALFASSKRAFIVDPCELLTIGLDACLSSGSHETVGCHQDVSIDLSVLEPLRPDIVILGPYISEHRAFHFNHLLRARMPNLPVMIIRRDGDDDLLQADALASGLSACMPIDATCEQCLTTIALISGGYVPFSHKTLWDARQPVALTPREIDVLKHMSTTQTYPEIAQRLGLQPATISNIAQRIIDKLQVHSRSDAVRRALRRWPNMLPLDDHVEPVAG